MGKLPPLPSGRVCKVREGLGFVTMRQKGSHVFYRHPDGRTTVVPLHRGEDISTGLLLKIIRDCGLSRDEFLEML